MNAQYEQGRSATGQINDPAFPVSSVLMEEGEVTLHYQHTGMSLRDWFAGQALTAVGHYYKPELKSEIADWCYIMADAMLEARESK